MKYTKWLFYLATFFLFLASCSQQENPREPESVVPEVKKIQPQRRFEKIGGRAKSIFRDGQGNIGMLVNDTDLLLLNIGITDTIARHKNFTGINVRKIVYWWDQQWQIGRLIAISALDFKAIYFTLTTDGRLQKIHGPEKFGDQKIWGACFQEFIIRDPSQEAWQYLWTVGSNPIIQRWRINSAGLINDPYIPVDFSRDDEPVFAMTQWKQWTFLFCNKLKLYALQQFPFTVYPSAADITGISVEGFLENTVVALGSKGVTTITIAAGGPEVGHPLKGDYTDIEVDRGRKKIYVSQLASILIVYDPVTNKSQTLAVDTDYITAVLLMWDLQHLAVFDTKGRANIFLVSDLLAGQNMQENNGAVYAP